MDISLYIVVRLKLIILWQKEIKKIQIFIFFWQRGQKCVPLWETKILTILLFLHQNKDNNSIEGLNLNYLNATKLKKLFQVIDFKKTKLDKIY